MQERTPWFIGIEWLRALMSVAVVAWHMDILNASFGPSAIFDPKGFRNHAFSLPDFVNFHLFLLAVPVFISVSCLLFALRTPSLASLMKILLRNLLMLAVLIPAGHAWLHWKGEGGITYPDSLYGALRFLLSGGGTLYYFFVSLSFCLAIAFASSRLSPRWNTVSLLASAFLLFVLPLLAISMQVPDLCAFWSPLNFVPCPFSATLIARYHKGIIRDRRRLIVILSCLIAAAVVLGFVEWQLYVDTIFFHGQPFAFPAYTRLSLLATSSALLLLALHPGAPRSRVVSFMSRHSLALYCLHPFFVLAEFRRHALMTALPAIVSAVTQVGLVIAPCYLLSSFKELLLRRLRAR